MTKSTGMTKLKTKQVKDEMFAQSSKVSNAWFACGRGPHLGTPIFNRGEVETAEKVARAFPNFEVRCTIGPYRGYDIAYEIDKPNKIITVDLYSPRPGVRYVGEVITEIHGKLKVLELKEEVKSLKEQLKNAKES